MTEVFCTQPTEKMEENRVQCSCSTLKREFQLKNFKLHHHNHRHFVKAQCGPTYFYPVWTTLWALFHVTSLLLQPYFTSLQSYSHPWPVYLTNFGYTILVVFSLCDCVATLFVHIRKKDLVSGNQLDIPWYIKAVWILYNTSSVISIFVTLGYFLLLPVEFSAASVLTHLLNAVFVIANVFICAKPTRLLHFYQPVIVATVYTLITIFYHAAGGSAIYPMLDWNDGVTVALLTSFGSSLVAVPLIHGLIYGLYRVRVLFNKHVCTRTQIDTIIQKENTDLEIKY